MLLSRNKSGVGNGATEQNSLLGYHFVQTVIFWTSFLEELVPVTALDQRVDIFTCRP